VKDSAIYHTPIFVDFKDANTIELNYKSPKTGEQKNAIYQPGKWFSLPEGDFCITITNFREIQQTQKELTKDAYYFELNRMSDVSTQIIHDLSVTILNPDAKTVQIKLKDKNNFKAADIVNGIATEFNKYDVEKNSESANKILDFIDNTIASIDIELSNSETSLENFKRNNKIIDPAQTIGSVTTKIAELETARYAIDHELDLFSAIKQEVDKNNELSRFILSLSGRSNDSQILNQLTRLQELVYQRDQLRLTATENSETYKAMQIRLTSQRDILFRTIVNEEIQMKSKREDIMRQLGEFDVKFGKLPAQQAEYGRLQRLFTINEKFYSLLLEKKAEFSVTRAGYVPQHVILQEASNAYVPVSPNRPFVISASLMIGFILSFILILTRYLLYNEINALEEIGQYTDAALLGIIPKYKREIPVSQLLVDKNPKSVISEAFRSIRTNLQFIANDDGAKIIAVTSTISGEGKTFNAINLAGVIAFSGKKVVILDIDMRKPKIHLGFNVENNHGISTLLIGKDTPEQCIIHSSLANLDFITAGPIPPNPAELIISDKMDQLLQYLKGIYEVIIVDLPPVGIVSDGIPMMQKADYPLYILRANYSRKMFIIQINKLIAENKVKNLSIILNGVEMSRIKYGYGYGYSYGYGYGYGYSYGYGYYEEDDKPVTLVDKFFHFVRQKNK
jgi:capsular exopolysaccharide synthesis family protein